VRQPLFVHSLFRAGSTYLWQAFRRAPGGYWCYQEPLHELVLYCNGNYRELLKYTSGAGSSHLRHPTLEKPYYQELVDVYEQCGNLIAPEIIYRQYFQRSASDGLVGYLRALCAAARGVPVIQECRTASRIGAIKQGLGGCHLYLWRNPWDQWWSYKVNDYFNAVNQVILNGIDRPPFIENLCAGIGFRRFSATDLAGEIRHFAASPLPPGDAYCVFYALWCHALLEAAASADLLLNIDMLTSSGDYRRSTAASLEASGFPGLEFDDCRISQGIYADEDRRFFGAQERRVHDMLLASGYQAKDIGTIESFRETHAVIPGPEAQAEVARLRQVVIRLETETARGAAVPDQRLIFLTICPANRMAQALTLFESVARHHPDAQCWLYRTDDVPLIGAPVQLPLQTVPVHEWLTGLPWPPEFLHDGMRAGNALKPCAFRHLFGKLPQAAAVYLDAGTFLIGPLEEVVREFARGADCILTPFFRQPEQREEGGDIALLIQGIYDPAFLGLRNSPHIGPVLESWVRGIGNAGVIEFVHKWMDLLPAYIENTALLRHAGYNLDYASFEQRTVRPADGGWITEQQPLRSIRLSGTDLDDPHLFSRFSSGITSEPSGGFLRLLNQYRDSVFRNGYAEYSRLAATIGGAAAAEGGGAAPPAQTAVPEAEDASASAGAAAPAAVNPSAMLFIDVTTPRPDRDAGSGTAYHLLKIFAEIGYDVTFVPSDLSRRGDYTAAVENLGVRCLHREDIGSIRQHLREHGPEYKLVFVCRAPIAGQYIDDIRKYARNAKLILNTSDLHYLRELREASISGDARKQESADSGRIAELDVLGRFDVIIVMSAIERSMLKKELPHSDVRLIPLMYMEPVADCPGFDDRQDILFIGGFPHLPNVDAVVSFCETTFPMLRKILPEVRFHIVGDAPPPEVLALYRVPGVVVHGFVADIAPLFRHCKVSVAPLRYGAGIKGKIGTSLAYGVPVVASSIAVEGMELVDGEQVIVADTPTEFAQGIRRLYESREAWDNMSRAGRTLIDRVYSPGVGRERIVKLMREIDAAHFAGDVRAGAAP
jgi:glycosyltransferase involved in cell wall biosynthesis